MTAEPTLSTVLGLSSLMSGAMFTVLAAFARQMQGIRLWACACVAIGLAALVDGLDLVHDPQRSAWAHNLPICIGQALVLSGILQFTGRHAVYPVLGTLSLVAVLLVFGFTHLVQNALALTLSLSLFLVICHAWSAWILWRHPEPFAHRVYRAAAVILLLHGLTGSTQAYQLLAERLPVLPLLPFQSEIDLWGAIIGTLFGNWMLFLLVMLRLVSNLHEAAERDALTGLLNRRGLRCRVEALVEEGRMVGVGSAVLLLDIDHFKAINDTYGHEMGDQVLVKMGDVLRSSTTVGALACRWGGEEFCVVLAGSTGDDALAVAERIRVCFQASTLGLLPEGATISIGMVWQPPGNGFDLPSLMGLADAELYRAKAAGRDQVSVTWIPVDVRSADAEILATSTAPG